MQAWVLDRHGDPAEVLVVRDVPEPVPGPGQLLVEVDVAGLGFPDLLRVRGEYQIVLPPGASPGQEFVGTVLAGGDGTSTEPGTRVLGVSQIGHGALAERVLANELDTATAAADLPAPIGAAVPANYGTAYVALHLRAGVKPGDAVVIAGAAGGVGSAGVQLAKAAGARVLAIDAGASKAAFCLELGADAAADSTADNLIQAINEFSGGRGADIVIDMVGGEVFEAARQAIASEGRIVIVGFTSGHIPEIKVNRLLLRNFTLMGMNAFHYQEAMTRCYGDIAALCVAGKLSPVIDGVYPFDSVPEVMDRLARGTVKGKAIVSVS